MVYVDLPYDYGTEVEVKFDNGSKKHGTVSAYTVMDDGYTIWVSGIKESWAGEFLPQDVVPV